MRNYKIVCKNNEKRIINQQITIIKYQFSQKELRMDVNSIKNIKLEVVKCKKVTKTPKN